jgi:hypothetical protein
MWLGCSWKRSRSGSGRGDIPVHLPEKEEGKDDGADADAPVQPFHEEELGAFLRRAPVEVCYDLAMLEIIHRNPLSIGGSELVFMVRHCERRVNDRISVTMVVR